MPLFDLSHGSLYKALARGRVDDERVRDLLVAHRPAHWPLVFAVDASSWPRCDAETSPERGFYYSASTHSAGQPIVAGWSSGRSKESGPRGATITIVLPVATSSKWVTTVEQKLRVATFGS